MRKPGAPQRMDSEGRARRSSAKEVPEATAAEHALPAEAEAAARRAKAQTPSRRPRAGTGDADSGRLFVTALARGLDVLDAFRSGDRALGNQELAARTGLPKPTVSRITHTLMQLGYLNYNPRLANYELGGRMLSLAFAALSNLDIRRVARPLMQKLADQGDMNITLGTRDKLSILNIETCEGKALIGLRLPPGSRMPIAITSTGKAYLAAAADAEREAILAQVRQATPEAWPAIEASVEQARRDTAEKGFCISIGEWQKDINGAAAPIVLPDGRGIYALGIGGPAYALTEAQILDKHGPMLARAAQEIAARLGGKAE